MKVMWEPLVVSIIFFIVRFSYTEPFGLQRSLMDASSSMILRIRSICDVYDDLTQTQREICHESSVQLIASIADGAEMARRECAKQFAHERWNCTVGSSRSLLGLMTNMGNKEAAFYYALMCAGIVHFMARDCMKGILDECHCGKAKRPAGLSSVHIWGGCGDNVEYALEFSKKFLNDPMLNHLNDKTNKKYAGKLLMHAHNSEAGRQAIFNYGRRVTCKCHGVTSQCSAKTCWYQLRDFDNIGKYLKKKHATAIKARLVARKKGKKMALKFKTMSMKSRSEELIYVENSPNYCNHNQRQYSTGTVGRQCNASLTGAGSCQEICCSKRFKTERKTITEKCRCKFFWCCDVICDYCDRVVDVHTCL